MGGAGGRLLLLLALALAFGALEGAVGGRQWWWGGGGGGRGMRVRLGLRRTLLLLLELLEFGVLEV